MNMLKRSGIYDMIGENNFYWSVERALLEEGEALPDFPDITVRMKGRFYLQYAGVYFCKKYKKGICPFIKQVLPGETIRRQNLFYWGGSQASCLFSDTSAGREKGKITGFYPIQPGGN